MVHSIVTFGRQELRQKARPVEKVTPAIAALAKDMLETMRAARGVGLASEQIGREESVCVIDVPAESEKPTCVAANAGIRMPLIMINPEIAATEGQQRGEEGCLSFPEISTPVTRANQVTAVYTDLDGNRQTVVALGLLARAIQHEIDHLNGILLVDRMSPLARLAMAGKLKRLQQESRTPPEE